MHAGINKIGRSVAAAIAVFTARLDSSNAKSKLHRKQPRIFGSGDSITGNLTSQECLRFAGSKVVLANNLAELGEALEYLDVHRVRRRDVIRLGDRGYVIRWE